MLATLTVQKCLARADRLRLLADAACDYDSVLRYETLAEEWLVLAGRLASRSTPAVAAPKLRFRLRNIGAWFRNLESLGHTARLK
jgi:hypothetical protein